MIRLKQTSNKRNSKHRSHVNHKKASQEKLSFNDVTLSGLWGSDQWACCIASVLIPNQEMFLSKGLEHLYPFTLWNQLCIQASSNHTSLPGNRSHDRDQSSAGSLSHSSHTGHVSTDLNQAIPLLTTYVAQGPNSGSRTNVGSIPNRQTDWNIKNPGSLLSVSRLFSL